MDVQTALNVSRTNGLVRPQDRAIFDALAKQNQAELPLLRQKVEATKKRLQLLESMVTEMEQGIFVGQSLSTPSPIRRLPPELLALVFTFACTGDTLQVFQKYNQPLPTCLTLVRVCKYWRDLAFGTKALWEHFIVIVQDTWPIPYDSDPSEEIAVLKGVVELYGKNLTHLYVDYEYCVNLNDEFFDLMFGLQDQLVSLALVNGDCIFGYIDSFEMPTLEELFLLGQFDDHGADGEPADVKFDAPNLKRVFLYCPEDEVTADNPSLPWNQINHLSLGSPCTKGRGDAIYADNFFNLLMQLPCLASLHLTQLQLKQRPEDSDEEPPSDRAQPVIAHQHLKYLELYDSYLILLVPFFSDDPVLLPHLSTPSLESFDLFFSIRTSRDECHELLHDVLVPFFQRTPSLRQIRLVLMPKADRLSSVSLSSPASFLQLTGKTTFFTLLSRIITDDEHDNSFAELGKRRQVPKGNWLSQQDVWTDRLIDRYINQFPVIPSHMEANTLVPASGVSRETLKEDYPDSGDEEDGSSQRSAEEGVTKHHYEAKDRRTMKVIFALLGDTRIPSHIQRHVYLAF